MSLLRFRSVFGSFHRLLAGSVLLSAGLLPAASAQNATVPDAAKPVVITPSAGTTQFFALNADGSVLGATSGQDSSYALSCAGASGFAAPTSSAPLAFDDFNRILYYAGTNGGTVKAVGIGVPYHGNSCGVTQPVTLAGSTALRTVFDSRHHSAYFLSTFGSGGPDVLTQVDTANINDYTQVGSLRKANQTSLDSGGTYTALVADADGIGLVAATELRTDSSAGGLWVYSPGLGRAYRVLGPGGADLPAVNAFIIPNPLNNGGSLLVLANQDGLTSSNIQSPPLVQTVFTIIDLGQLRDLIGTAATASSVTLPFVTTINTGTTPYAIFGAGYDPVARRLYSLQGGGTSITDIYKVVMRYDPYSPASPGESMVASLNAVPLTFGSLPQVAVNSAAQTMQLLTTNPDAAWSFDISGTTSSSTAQQVLPYQFNDPNFDPTYVAANGLAGETYFASNSGNVDVLTLPAGQKPAGLIDIIAPDTEAQAGAVSDIALLSTFPVPDTQLSTTNITVTATAASTKQSFTFATIAASSTRDLPRFISGIFPATDTYTLVASFPGDATYPAFTSAVAVVAVGVAPYTTGISVSANATSTSSAIAQVTLQGSTYTPTGVITLTDSGNGNTLATKVLNGALSNPITIPFNFGSTGTQYVTASYSGDTNNSASTSAPTLITAKTTTTTVLTAPANVTTNQNFSGTVLITSSGITPPSGYSPTALTTITATQVGGTTSFIVGQVRANQAYQQAATVDMTIPVDGTWKLVAHYPGDTYFLASDSAPVVVTSSAAAPAVTVSPNSLSFVSALNTPSTQSFTVTNSGSATLNISSIASSVPATFSVQNGCGATLAAKASCTVTVTFTPAATGTSHANITIASDAPAGNTVVALTGSTPSTTISLTPQSLTFTGLIGQASAYQDVVLLNTGNQSVTISSIATNNQGFAQINGCPASLSPGFQCTIRVQFTPTNAGSYVGRLNVTDNASGSPQQVALTGTAVAPISLSSSVQAFTDQMPGTSAKTQAVVVLSNATNAAVTIQSATLTDRNNFEILSSTCGPQLGPNSFCSYNVEFHPVASGQQNTQLSVATSGGSVSTLLAGVGMNPNQCTDADGDGLCDDWETNGYIAHVNNKDVFVDLPSMGADPKHKDIFLHIDWMQTAAGIPGAHTHQPLAAAMQLIVKSFSNAPVTNLDGTTGIRLHIDCGGCFTGTGAIGGTLSAATKLAEVASLDPTAFDKNTGAFSWTTFDNLATTFQGTGRSLAFHHVLFAHDQHPGYSSSGISRNDTNNFNNGGSDLIVSLGSWTNSVGTANQQGGTLMHELGHNLALHHGGQDDDQYKANYLSIMNYLYQTVGLITNGANNLFDYSENALPTLYETNLNETTGLNYKATDYPAIGPLPSIDKVGAAYYCPGSDTTKVAPTEVASQNSKINFDCDTKSVYSTKVIADINADGGSYDPGPVPHPYYSYKDWPKLNFRGGAIAGNGIGAAPVASSVADTYSQNEESLTRPLTRVTITSPGMLQTAPGSTTTLRFLVTNTGVSDDVYALTTSSAAGWGGSTATPASVTLASGASQEVTVSFTVPAKAADGDSDTITLTAASTKFTGVSDSAQAEVSASSSPAPFAVSVANVDFGTANNGASSSARAVVITNTGTAALTFPSITTSAEFSQTNTCGAAVSAGSSCVINVTFSPANTGTRTGTLSITSSASSTPVTVALTGTSVTPPLPRPSVTLTLSPAATSTGQTVTMSVNVAQTSGTTVPTGTVTISNAGTALGTITLDSHGNGSFITSKLAAGTYDLLASYSGDSAFQSANAPVQTLTIVNAAQSSVALTASAANIAPGGSVTLTATVPTSSGTNVPTGTVTFYDGTTVLGTGSLNGSGVATYNAASLANGTHSLTASYGGDAVYGASVSSAVSVTVATITPTVALSSSASTVVTGTPVTLTATLTATTGTPAGTVTFLDGTNTLGTATLNGSGVATYTASSLSIGTHSIVAQYAANGIYSAAVSAVRTVVVTGVPDFNVTASPGSLTVARGASGNVTFTVTPVNGYAGTVRLSCGSLPANAECAFNPAQLTFSATSQTAQTAVMTIDTRQHAAVVMPGVPGKTSSRVEFAAMFAPVLLGIATLRRRRKFLGLVRMAAVVLLLSGVAAAVSGCASGPATVTPGTYSVTVTVTDGTINHALNYTVNVN